jgi:DNA primase
MNEKPSYIPREQLLRARQTNLAEYLISRGEPLIQAGIGRYKHDEHGNAIDFLRSYYDMDFKSAVQALTGEIPRENLTKSTAAGQGKRIVSPSTHERDFKFSDIVLAPEMRRVIEYLSGRGISQTLILELISRRLLFQEARTNNIIFPIYDGDRIVGAEVAGSIPSKRFKGVKSGSKYGYGYNLSFGNDTNYVLLFESAIDLVSFVDIEKTHGKSLTDCRFVSLAGLKENIAEREIAAANADIQVFVCVDNDEAGANFIKELTERYANIKPYLPDKVYKDWNEQIQAMCNI